MVLFYSKTSAYCLQKPKVPATSQRLKGQLKNASDVFHTPSLNNQAKERTGYPTQKPIALLNRTIEASSEENVIVLDPFCSCATTLVAADALQRKWLGIDVLPIAVRLVTERITQAQGVFKRIVARDDVPQRTNLGKLLRYGHPENKTQLCGTQRGNCSVCSVHFRLQDLTINHFIPRPKGGTNHNDGLQLLCGYGNSVKRDRCMDWLIARLAA